MNEFIETIKYILPSLVVFITAYSLIRLYLDDVKNKRVYSSEENQNHDYLKAATKKILLPLKIQAYERTILYLERISPESLIMRNHRSGMTALDIQRELLKNIREEFEHNLSQQIYLEASTWDAVKFSKEELTKLVKLAGSQVESSASALAYSETFLKMSAQLQHLPTKVAIEKIRSEFQKEM